MYIWPPAEEVFSSGLGSVYKEVMLPKRLEKG